MKEIDLDKIRKKLNTNTYKLDYKNSLNPEQYEAVCAKEGKILLLAGAGTGKTNTLTYRTAKLIEDGVAPESILMLTFTKKAANEMTKRANSILDERCSKIYSSTYHGFASNMLRIYGKHIELANNFTILDQSDAEDAINFIRAELKLDKKERKFPKKSVLMQIFSSSINKYKTIQDIIYENYQDLENDIPDIIKCFDEYKKFKKEKQILDYDDLLVKLYELLSTDSIVCEKISSRFKYIMVDEYQDSNILQANILKKLCTYHGNLMCVGDPMQSIYGFRGAHFENIMNFTEEFEDVKVLKLFKNYRSTQQILDLSNALMKSTDIKYYNPLKSDKLMGYKPSLVYLPDGNSQSLFITQEIIDLYEQGISLNDICVLTRNAYLTAELQIMLTSANIKFHVVGGRKFLDAAHIKDMISFVKILVNPNDSIAWLRVLQLHEGIGTSTAKNIINSIDTLNGFKFKDDKKTTSLRKKKWFPYIENLLDILNLSLQNNFEIQFDMVTEYYVPLMNSIYEDAHMRDNDIDMFKGVANKYKTAEQFLTDITLDPSEVSLKEDTDTDEEYLTISTIHSAKGLEWHTVFNVYAVEGVQPSSKSLNSIEEIHEEMRLFYVAITRAKNNLYICIPAEKFSFGKTERTETSRFLLNIDNLEDVVDKCSAR